MRAKDLYKELKKQAKAIEDKENTKLYVSDTVSAYIRAEIKKLVNKELEYIVSDYEIGVLNKDEAIEMINTEKLICKSL